MPVYFYREPMETRMDKLVLTAAEMLADSMDCVVVQLSDQEGCPRSVSYPKTVDIALRIAALCRCLTEAISRYEKVYEMERARELAEDDDLPF